MHAHESRFHAMTISTITSPVAFIAMMSNALHKAGWGCEFTDSGGEVERGWVSFTATLPTESRAVNPTSSLIDFRDASVLLGLSVKQLRGLVKRGDLLRAPFRGTKKHYFNLQAVLAWASRKPRR